MKKLLLSLATGLAGYALSCGLAHAQVTIDQNKAMAGNVTPGDTAGFPITISQPGSYKLTGNLTVPAGVMGIEITADNVTLDLNGYTVRGPVTCLRNSSTRIVSCSALDAFAFGIFSMQKDSVVRNGSVRGFGAMGVYFTDSGSGSAENLRVSHNGGMGIKIARGNMVGVEAELNGTSGIVVGGMATRCTARDNGGTGIQATYAQENMATGNHNYGIDGRVRANVANDNGISNFTQGSISMGANLNGFTLY